MAEWLEQIFLAVLGYANAGVPNLEGKLVGVCGGMAAYPKVDLSLAGKFDGIAQQINQNLAQP